MNTGCMKSYTGFTYNYKPEINLYQAIQYSVEGFADSWYVHKSL